MPQNHCRMLPHLEVVHYDCDEYQDGIITKVSDGPDNGRIIAKITNGKRVEK